VTISVQTHVQQRPWRGYDDPGLPVGMYVAQNAVTADASGGRMTVIFNFRNEGSAASGRYYNIEQIEAQHTGGSAVNVFLIAVNWDLVGPAGLINREWAARTRNGASGLSALSTDTVFPVPIFLGITSPVASLAAQLQIGTDNTNGTAFTTTIQGYIWEARSVLSEGGLRRPMDSLYSSGKQ